MERFYLSLEPVGKNLYACDHETTNLEYRLFLKELRDSGKIAQNNICSIDSNAWKTVTKNYLLLTKHYHSHQSYNDYPVVNISHDAAVKYCKWLTKKYNTLAKRNFKKVKFKLPSESEWLIAARGGLDTTAIFPWEGTSLEDKEMQSKYKQAWYLCNFKHISQECIKKENIFSTKLIIQCDDKKETNITTLAESFMPNNYGLYNVCGNVAEMLEEKGRTKGGSWNSTGYYMRLDSEDEYEGWKEPSPMIGFRVFMEVIEE